MNTERSRTILHRTFIVITVVGLVLNVAFDLAAFKKNKESDLMGDRVARSFQTLLHLERVQSNEATENLRQKAIDEVVGLQKADSALEDQVESEMMRALIGDLGLVGIMLFLFILNMQAKRKAEQNLKASLNNMRESLTNLEEKAIGRRIASKMAVHDLKNPIGSIMGFAQLMYDDPKSELSVTEFSDRIRQISERSLVLVESLLSEHDTEEMVKQKVNLVPIIEDISSQLEVQALQKSQKIIQDLKISQAYVLGNTLKLEEVISNLLSNAIKYSPADSKIRISVSSSVNFVKVDVEDQGPGFSEEDKRNAFQFGKKLSAVPTNNESSTGYGLYIVKQIVESFGGEVEILDSTSGQGAHIQVRLPILKEKEFEISV